MRLKDLFAFICSLTSMTYGSNILAVFPHPGYSHFLVFSPIMHGLADRGHNVTVVSYFKSEVNHKSNYKEIILTGEKILQDVVDLNDINPSRSIDMLFWEFYFLTSEGQRACHAFFNTTAFEDIINFHKQIPYDLVIYEVFNSDCVLGLADIISSPIVGLSSCALMPWHYDRVSLPDSPSFIPSEFVGFSEKMSLYERIVNFIMTKSLKALYRIVELKDEEIIRQRLQIDVDVHEISKKTALILVNQHYSLSGARPLSNQVIEIGGVHIKQDGREKNDIKKDLEDFLNESDDGVILISWGSMVKTSTLPKDKLNAILDTISRLPYRVVWKWENKTKPINDPKFFFSQWIPQKDVLCHPNVRLFWSHGGMLGTSESCYCGVPIVVTPIYGDQFVNGRATENRKFGKILYYQDITKEKTFEVLSEILKPEYQKNAKYVSKIYKNRENPPLETAIWWIEHVIETNGNNLLRSESLNLNWFMYYSIDAIVIIAIILLLIIIFIVHFIKFLRNQCCRKFIKQPKIKVS